MLLPSGGAKGFGLSFMIDLLCGLLSQGATGSQVRPLYGDYTVAYDCSHLFIAIDVAHFCDLDWFRKQAAATATRIRVGQRISGVAQLFTPGEPEWRRRKQAAGHVQLDAPWPRCSPAMRGSLGVDAISFQSRMQEKQHA